MKGWTAFFKDLIPVAASLGVYSLGLRPLTWVLDLVDGLLKQPLGLQDTVKVGLDIALLTAALKNITWPTGIRVVGRMANSRTLGNHTWLIASNSPVPANMRLSLQLTVKAKWALTVLRWLGGALLVIKPPGNTISLEHDQKLKADQVYLCHQGLHPAIKFTDQLYDGPPELALDYTLQALANGQSVPNGKLKVVAKPAAQGGFRRFLGTVVLWALVTVSVDEHLVYIQA